MTAAVRALLALMALSIATETVASAQSVHDTQLWTEYDIMPRLTPEWRVHLELQPRWSEDVSDLNQVIVRAGLGRQLTDRVSVWGGYGHIFRTLGPGTRHEQRVWEQLSVTFPAVRKWTPSLRLRLEQRFLDTWADSSHRLRIRGRFVRPIDANGRWNVVGQDELMITLDETARGPWQGVDQNRLFGGINRRLSPDLTVEGGYLWQTLEPPQGVRANAHVGLLLVTVNF